MKKSNLILATMAILGLAACSKPQAEVAPKIDLSQSEVSFEVEGGEATISFTSAREWEVTAPDNDWLLVEPSKGEGSDKPQTITLRATANTGANRSLELTLQSTFVLKKTITVSQIGDPVPGGKEGLVMARSTAGVIFSGNDGEIFYAYDAAVASALKVGDKVKIAGEESSYNDLPELINCSWFVLSSDNEVKYPEAKKLDGAGLDALVSANIFSYVTLTGKLTINGSYYNIAVPGASTNQASISYPVDFDASLDGKNVDLTGYFIGISGTKYCNVVATGVKLSDDQTMPEEPEEPDTPVDGVVDNGDGTFTATKLVDYFIEKDAEGTYIHFNAGNISDVISYTNTYTYQSGNLTEFRIYKSQTLTLTAASGYTITKVDFTCTVAAGVKYGFYETDPITVDSGATATATPNDKDTSIAIEGNTSSVAINAKENQMRITRLAVTYKAL